MSTVPAVVAYNPDNGQMKWKYEHIPTPRQPREHELLVKMVSTGICHTDIYVSHIPDGLLGFSYPKVFGHEGAGYVEAVGPGVTVAAVGDPVILSYTHCAACDLCKNDMQTYCEQFTRLNVVGESGVFSGPDSAGPEGKFFGQSSFAALSIVDEKCIVNVKDSLQTFEELKRCAPLGCGFMTGAGASLSYLKPHDILVVTGLGAVGMGAIMAAKQVGVKAIIAVDRVESRLEIAKEVGATHIYNNADKDPGSFVNDVRALVGDQRISYAMDTTGHTPLIEQSIMALGKRGRMILIGVPGLDKTVTLPMGDFFNQTKTVEVNFLGNAKAQELVPQMIKWYKEGKFPLDKLIRFYHVDKVQEALEDMKGKVIKPILVY